MMEKPCFPGLMLALMMVFNLASGQAKLYSQNLNGVTVGGDFRDDGRTFSFGYERNWGKRLAVKPTVGIGMEGNHLSGSGFSDGIFWKYAGSFQLKYFFLLHKRHLLEGIYAFGHLGYFRRSLVVKPENYVYYRNYRSEIGLGMGGQWIINNKIILGGNVTIPWTNGTDWLGNPDGSTYVIFRRTGFVVVVGLHAGIIF
ncbi:MAG TPA: hypothetical protein ENJ82_12815 [Bacteroidetes bacterium]|nr:hypothetical protein [Bacteroidota bacterium]